MAHKGDRHDGMEREDYTLTMAEWESLGGTFPPDDYDPTRRKKTVGGSVVQKGVMQGHDTGLVPTFQHVDVIWAKVAERLGVRMLTIHWPDAHYPDITAKPLRPDSTPV